MVRMIGGAFLLHENGRVIVKDKTSAPFDAGACEDELIRAGIAVHVDDEPEQDTNEVSFGVPDDIKSQLPDGTEVEVIPEYSVDSSAKELREIGEKLGLTFGARMTKAEMVDALDDFMAANVKDGIGIDDLDDPDLTFDASKAVQ